MDAECHETWQVRDVVSLVASHVSLEEGMLISPKVFAQTRWDEMRGFNLYRNIRHEGLKLSLEEGQLSLSPL